MIATATKLAIIWIALGCGRFVESEAVFAQESHEASITGTLTDTINVSNTPGRSIHPIGTAGQDDDVHLFWMDNSPGNFDVFYSKWNGEHWTPASNVSDNSTISMFPTAVVDLAGKLHVTYMDGEIDGDLHIVHSQLVDSKWTPPKNISNAEGISQRPQIVVDSSGVVHAVWYGNQGGFFELYHSRLVKSAWTKPTNTGLVEWYITHNPGWTRRPGLAAGPGNAVHLAWVGMEFDSSSPYALTQNVRHSRWDGISWKKPDNVSKLAGTASIEEPGLCVGENGDLHAAWEDRGKSWYGKFDGNRWSEPEQFNTGGLKSELPAVAYSPEGQLHFTWLGVTKGTPQVYYRQMHKGQWSDTINVSESPKSAFGCSLVFDHTGGLHMTWMDSSSGEYEILHRRVVARN
jgi:hypothetical protein